MKGFNCNVKVIFIWSLEEKRLSHLLRCVSAFLCRYLCRLFESCVCWGVSFPVWQQRSVRRVNKHTHSWLSDTFQRTNTSTLWWQTHLEYFGTYFSISVFEPHVAQRSWSTWDVVHVMCSPDVTTQLASGLCCICGWGSPDQMWLKENCRCSLIWTKHSISGWGGIPKRKILNNLGSSPTPVVSQCCLVNSRPIKVLIWWCHPSLSPFIHQLPLIQVMGQSLSRPHLPLHIHFLPFFQGEPLTFPNKLKVIIFAARPGSPVGPPHPGGVLVRSPVSRLLMAANSNSSF